MRVRGNPIVKGHAKGPAMFTEQPVNFTAAFTKMWNLLPMYKSSVMDRHHPWYNMNVKGKVLFIPAAIGSTHTGLVLLDLTRMENGPAAIIVGHADSLLVSGVILSEVWFDRAIPIVEYPVHEIAPLIGEGDTVEVDGDTGEIYTPGAPALTTA